MATEAAGPVGAVVSAVLALAAAAVTATAGVLYMGGKLAVEAVEARERWEALFGAMQGGSREAGAATLRMLDEVSDRLGMTREKLAPYAKQLLAIGITDLSQLRGQIQSVAAVTAAMGDAGAEAYTSLIAKTQTAIDAQGRFKVPAKQITQWPKTLGMNLDELAARMGMTAHALEERLKTGLDPKKAKQFQTALGELSREKFAGPLGAQALELSNQWDKFKENLSKAFEDCKPGVTALEKAVARFFALISGDKSSGRVMRSGLTAAFNFVLEKAVKFVDFLTHAFLRIEIAALKIAIWARPWIRWFQELNARYGILDKILTVVKWIGIALAVNFGLAVASVVISLSILAGIVTAVSAGVDSLGRGIDTVVGWFGLWKQAMSQTVSIEAAKDFVDGLVQGITDGIDDVVNAAKNLGQSALDTITGLFESHSPSLVLKNIGQVGVAGGLALGMTTGIPDVTAAAADVAGAVTGTIGEQVAEPAPRAQPVTTTMTSTATASSSSHREVNISFAPGSIVLQGAGKSAEGLTEELISIVFERIALEQGC
jgi:hypothetical protein